MDTPAPANTASFHLPRWVVILLLLFIPPVGWWHMWKNHRYHSWFPYLLWLNAAIMLGFAAYIAVHFYPLLTNIVSAATYIFLTHVGLIILAIFEIALGFYLIKKCKKEAMLRTRLLLLVILLLFVNAIAIPISQLFLVSHFRTKAQKNMQATTTLENNRIATQNQKETTDTSLISNVISRFPKNITWQKLADAKISYTDFATPNAKQRFISGTAQTGIGTVASLVNAQVENKQYLKQNGWAIDNNQAADGPTGSVWGYKKTVDNKTQILQLSYTNNSITPVPNQPLQITCPCNLTYKIFLSDPF